MLDIMILFIFPAIALIYTGAIYYWMLRFKYRHMILILYCLGMFLMGAISSSQFMRIPDIYIRLMSFAFMSLFYPTLMFFIGKEYYILYCEENYYEKENN